MSVLAFLVAWANAPFSIAAGVVGLFALLQVTGLLGVLGGGDADHVDHDIDHDVEADVDHDIEQDADGDHEDDGGDRGWGAIALGPLGAGKIPLSVIWQTFALVFAAAGFGLNLRYLARGAPPPLYSLAWTFPFAFAVAYVAVAFVARVLGPVLSSKEQEATGRGELVGQIGVVISSRVDQEFGEVRIRDKTGHDVRVICKLSRASAHPASEHENVVVVDYDEDRGDLFVERLDDGAERLT